MPRGRRERTRELYNRILAAYREAGEIHVKAARLAGVDRGTAARVHREGWPDVEGALPVKDVLEQDRILLRAARAAADHQGAAQTAAQVLAVSLEGAREGARDAAEMLARAAERAREMEARAAAALEESARRLEQVEALAREKASAAEVAAQATLARAEVEAKQRLAELLARAKVDAAETLADEANAAKFGRKAALSAAAIAALVLKDAQGIAAQLREALKDISKLSPHQAIRVAREMVRLVESAEKALILALQAERLRVGQPTEVIGVQGYDSTLEEKEIKVRAVARALERARAKGLSVVKGGEGGDAAAAPGAPRAG